MPLGVTTLAQFNGVDGLGETSQTETIVGIGGLAALIGLLVYWGGGSSKNLSRNGGSKRRKLRANGVKPARKLRPNKFDRPYKTGHENKDYKHFIVYSGTILSGWEFLKDARDAKKRLAGEAATVARICSRKHCKSLFLDPSKASSWQYTPSASGRKYLKRPVRATFVARHLSTRPRCHFNVPVWSVAPGGWSVRVGSGAKEHSVTLTKHDWKREPKSRKR